MPMADAVIDLHSGGHSLDFVFLLRTSTGTNPARCATRLFLARAFGAPLTVMFDDRGEERTILATAKRLGIPAMTTELGGGATLSVAGLKLCMDAVAAHSFRSVSFREAQSRLENRPDLWRSRISRRMCMHLAMGSSSHSTKWEAKSARGRPPVACTFSTILAAALLR